MKDDGMKKDWREQMLINALAPAASGVLANCFLPLVATLLEQHFPSEHQYNNSNSIWRSRQEDEQGESASDIAFNMGLCNGIGVI